MNQKHFIINPKRDTSLTKEDIASIEKEKQQSLRGGYEKNKELTRTRMGETYDLKHVEGRIVIKIDLNFKDSHKFEDGTEIYIGRRFNNLNVRETNPVNAIVISADGIPKGAEILIHPNSVCDTNKINGYESISNEQGNSVRFYSIETISAFLWRKDSFEWEPLKGFVTALRVFKPYKGFMIGVPHKKLENVLYLTSSEYRNKVVHTVKAADYEIIFMDHNGIENRIIRCRHYENEIHDREELTCIDHSLTELVNKGELFVGISETNCKNIKNG